MGTPTTGDPGPVNEADKADHSPGRAVTAVVVNCDDPVRKPWMPAVVCCETKNPIIFTTVRPIERRHHELPIDRNYFTL